MQFSEHWLRQFVNPALDADALGHALTMAGLEVEEQTLVAPPFSHVVVGEIIATERHPDADRLQVCQVAVGETNSLQIVCGAPNARVGLKVPCARIGAHLPDFKIKQAKVRGVESYGMLCSAKELGLVAEADGLLELSSTATVGQDVREHLDLDDTLYTIKLTPNRADCLSILGIARDVTAITGAAFTYPEIIKTDITSELVKAVTVTEPVACPSYYGRVIAGVNANTPTPDWMQRALLRSGLRSISAIVDISNYVLLELGQPMHAFDLDKLSGDIVVRYAKKGEQIKLLNDAEAMLAEDDLLIADDSGPIALAGIMGGEPTSVCTTTSNIFLEAAFFTPEVMAGKARRLGLSTDSSYRFERGVDYGHTEQALERATTLVLDICGGHAGPITAQIERLPERNKVTLRQARIESVLGINVSKEAVANILTQLGFSYEQTHDCFIAQAPTYRFDIALEADLIEEVARLYGYDKIPAIAPVSSLTMLPLPEAKRDLNWLKDDLQSLGYQEIITYSFVEESWERTLSGNQEPIRLKNPIASNLSVMRSGLWGNLLDALTYNLNRQQDRIMLFETGRTYHRAEDGYHEQTVIAGLCYGLAKPAQWGEIARDFDFYDMKAAVDVLSHQLASYEQDTHPALHPGQTARVYLHGTAIGWLGRLHPKYQQQYDLPKNAMMFELNTEQLLSTTVVQYLEVSKFLPVRRDIAIIVDQSIAVQTIINAVQAEKIPLLQKIQLFDLYQGKGIEQGKKSLAFLILMQDTDRTLTDLDAEATMTALLKLLNNKFNAQLRN